MKFTVAMLCVSATMAIAYAGLTPITIPGTTLVRTPSLDTAYIQSDRLGGNFAYSTVEGHAYQAITPLVRNIIHPVAVNYQLDGAPIGIAHAPSLLWHQPLYSPIGGIVLPGVNVAIPEPATVTMDESHIKPIVEDEPAMLLPAGISSNREDGAKELDDDDSVSVDSA